MCVTIKSDTKVIHGHISELFTNNSNILEMAEDKETFNDAINAIHVRNEKLMSD